MFDTCEGAALASYDIRTASRGQTLSLRSQLQIQLIHQQLQLWLAVIDSNRNSIMSSKRPGSAIDPCTCQASKQSEHVSLDSCSSEEVRLGLIYLTHSLTTRLLRPAVWLIRALHAYTP